MSHAWIFSLLAALLIAGSGCGKKKEITSLQRKEAASLVSEAQFALTLRELPRAEGLLTKAAALCPDTGDYWTTLGTVRMRMGRRDAAREAYKRGLKAFEEVAALNKADPEPLLQQVTVLALLGRVSEARTLTEKLGGRFPSNRKVRLFIEGKNLDRMLADPGFKEIAF